MSKSNESEVIWNKFIKQIKSLEINVHKFSTILSNKIMIFFLEKLCIFNLRNKTYQNNYYEFPIAYNIKYYSEVDDHNYEWNHNYEMYRMHAIFQQDQNLHQLSYDSTSRYIDKPILIKEKLTYLLSILSEKKSKITRNEIDNLVFKYIEGCKSITKATKNDLIIMTAVLNLIISFLELDMIH
jgi:hypothetical protein